MGGNVICECAPTPTESERARAEVAVLDAFAIDRHERYRCQSEYCAYGEGQRVTCRGDECAKSGRSDGGSQSLARVLHSEGSSAPERPAKFRYRGSG